MHDKNSQQNKNRKELPQSDKKAAIKIPQPASYSMVKD